MIDPLGFQRVEQHRHQIASRETAGVREVVDARHHHAHHTQDDGIPDGFTANEMASGSPAVVYERAEKTEDRRRRAKRVAGAAEQRQRRHVGTGERAQQKSARARHRENNHHAARAVHIGHHGPEVADPHHVEHNVQQAAMQPARAEDRPPSAGEKDRHGAAGAEQDDARGTGHQKRESAADDDQIASRHQQLDDVQRAAHPDHELDEPEIVAETPEQRRKAPQPRIPAPAVEASVVAHADQRSARRADDRPGCLTLEERHKSFQLPASSCQARVRWKLGAKSWKLLY